MDNFVTSNYNNHGYMEPPIYRKENMGTVSKRIGIQYSTDDKKFLKLVKSTSHNADKVNAFRFSFCVICKHKYNCVQNFFFAFCVAVVSCSYLFVIRILTEYMRINVVRFPLRIRCVSFCLDDDTLESRHKRSEVCGVSGEPSKFKWT